MKSKFKKFRDRYFDYSMIRWAVVGVCTALIDYFLFITLFGPIKSVFMANLISASVSTSINYYTHHRWTFKSDQNHSKSGVKYLLNLFFWWLVSSSIIKALVILEIDPRLAKLAPLPVIASINYFVLNKIVFKNKSKNPFA